MRILQSGETPNTDDLAKILRCSRRTVFRDINLLRESGINVWFDRPTGGYKTDYRIDIPTESLDEDQLAALLAAAKVSWLAQLVPFVENAGQAIDTAIRKSSSRVRDRVGNLVQAIAVGSHPPSLSDSQIKLFENLIVAINDENDVSIYYQNPKSATVTCRQLVPRRLVARRNGWKLVGQSAPNGKTIEIDLNSITELKTDSSTQESNQSRNRAAKG